MKNKLKEPIWPYDRPDFCQLSYQEIEKLKEEYYKDSKKYWKEYYLQRTPVKGLKSETKSIFERFVCSTFFAICGTIILLGFIGILCLIFGSFPNMDLKGWLLILELVGLVLFYIAWR